MANIKVYPYLSPRIVEVLAPDTEISIQELVNLVRDWEDEDDNMSFDYIISAAGKEDLGSGVTVGITATLNNAQVMFTGRTTPIDDGVGRTCDATNINGLQLYVDDADFISDGVTRGDIVYNATTGSMATITEVVDQYNINHLQLYGGANTQWTNGDNYVVYHNAQCNIDGGNLVAVDTSGASISSTLSSANVQIVRTSSSSATLQELDAIQYSSFGNAAWLDPINGTSGTAYPIGTPEFPSNNWDDIHTIAESNGFTDIQIIGDYTFSSTMYVTDGYNFIGRGFQTSTFTFESGCIIANCELYAAKCTGNLTGVIGFTDCLVEGIGSVGLFPSSQDVVFERCAIAGTQTLPSNYSGKLKIINCWSDSGLSTLDVGDSTANIYVVNFTGDIALSNVSNPVTIIADLNSGQIVLNDTCTDGNITIRGIGRLTDNSLGITVYADELLNKENIVKANWDKVWLDVDHGVAGTTFPIGTIEQPSNNMADALTILSGIGSERIHAHGSITLTQDLSDVSIEGHGYGSCTINFNGHLLTEVKFESLTVTGTAATGSLFSGDNCRLNSVTNIRGSWENAICYGNFVIDAGQYWNGDRCTFPANSNIDMNGNGSIGMANTSGVITLNNSTNVANTISVTGTYLLTLDATCTDGNALIAGIGILTDNSTLSLLDRTLPSATVSQIKKLIYPLY